MENKTRKNLCRIVFDPFWTMRLISLYNFVKWPRSFLSDHTSSILVKFYWLICFKKDIYNLRLKNKTLLTYFIKYDFRKGHAVCINTFKQLSLFFFSKLEFLNRNILSCKIKKRHCSNVILNNPYCYKNAHLCFFKNETIYRSLMWLLFQKILAWRYKTRLQSST